MEESATNAIPSRMIILISKFKKMHQFSVKRAEFRFSKPNFTIHKLRSQLRSCENKVAYLDFDERPPERYTQNAKCVLTYVPLSIACCPFPCSVLELSARASVAIDYIVHLSTFYLVQQHLFGNIFEFAIKHPEDALHIFGFK